MNYSTEFDEATLALLRVEAAKHSTPFDNMLEVAQHIAKHLVDESGKSDRLIRIIQGIAGQGLTAQKAAQAIVDEKSRRLSLLECPLCLGKLTRRCTETNTKLKTGKRSVLGVVPGRKQLEARCENGCAISIRAAHVPGVTGRLLWTAGWREKGEFADHRRKFIRPIYHAIVALPFLPVQDWAAARLAAEEQRGRL